MNNKYLLIAFMMLFFRIPLTAQILIENHFDNYIGTAASTPEGWYLSWHMDSTQSALSFYPSPANSGNAAPSYKFGMDSVYIISPAFSNADTLRFYLKGNGSPAVENTLDIYSSADSINWSPVTSLDSSLPSAVIVSVPIPVTASHVAFVYRKHVLGYNAGIDDIYIHRGAFATKMKTNEKLIASFRPNPVNTKVTFDFAAVLPGAEIHILNILGNEVFSAKMVQPASSYSMNLSSLDEGIYFVKVTAFNQTITKRMVVKH